MYCLKRIYCRTYRSTKLERLEDKPTGRFSMPFELIDLQNDNSNEDKNEKG